MISLLWLEGLLLLKSNIKSGIFFFSDQPSNEIIHCLIFVMRKIAGRDKMSKLIRQLGHYLQYEQCQTSSLSDDNSVQMLYFEVHLCYLPCLWFCHTWSYKSLATAAVVHLLWCITKELLFDGFMMSCFTLLSFSFHSWFLSSFSHTSSFSVPLTMSVKSFVMKIILISTLHIANEQVSCSSHILGIIFRAHLDVSSFIFLRVLGHSLLYFNIFLSVKTVDCNLLPFFT